MCELISYESFEEGQCIYKFNAHIDKMFILIDGEVDFSLEMKHDKVSEEMAKELAIDIDCPDIAHRLQKYKN